MKRVYQFIFLSGLFIMLGAPAIGQNLAKKRVERYLFSSYDMTKAGLKEKERLIVLLSNKMDEYVLLLDKEGMNRFKAKEKEFDQFLNRIESVTDIRVMQQMVQESSQSHKLLIASILEKGIKNPEEANECRKAIAFLIMDQELLKAKNEKLVVLLKDDYSRTEFVELVMASGKITEETDTKILMVTVDLSLADYEI